MNYETVKAFNNEALERSRYKEILRTIKNTAMAVQKSLANLNIGQ
jgi:ABC-type transport system involved in Fe-S cluster assembly fused permease/ATPase subunit